MALTLLKINEAQILAEEQGEMVVMLLKEAKYDIDTLMETFFSFRVLPTHLIQEVGTG